MRRLLFPVFFAIIPAMQQAMPTLRDHKSLFRQFLAGMYDAVLITDPSGHLVEINRRTTEYFGYVAEDLTDRPVGALIPGVDAALVERIRRGLDDGRRVMLDAKCLRRDGSKFPAEVTISEIDLFEPGDLVFTVRSTERRPRPFARPVDERAKTKEG